MPTPLAVPFPPLLVLPRQGLVSWVWLEPLIRNRIGEGVSLCITSGSGDPNRGGYFFHLRQTTVGFEFATFDRMGVLTLGSGEECAGFINHVSGRVYQEDMWLRCQMVNLRPDSG